MANSSVSVEELGASLVREYLARKGLRGTLTKLDEEFPRSSESISNRTALAKAVHVEKLMRKNKADGAPYRTMIEVIVKFLITSASRKVSNTSHETTPTKCLNPREGVADSTAGEMGGAGATSRSDVPTHKGGLNSSALEKSKVHQDVDVDTLTATSKLGSLSTSQYGKPITKSSTTSPITDVFLHSYPTTSHLTDVLQSTPSHLDKPMYPKTEPSPLSVGTRYGMMVEPRKHLSTLLQKERTSVVRVKPRGDVQIQSNSCGSSGGIINVTSGRVISPRSTSSTRSSARGVLKSGHTSLTSREVPTLKLDSKAESAKQNPYQRRQRNRGSTEMTISQDEATSSSHASLITKSVKLESLLREGSEVAGSNRQVQQANASDHSSDGTLLCEDLEDTDISISLSSTPPPLVQGLKRSSYPKGRPIDFTTAKALRELIFGTATDLSFNAEWRRQNFEFSDVPKLEYGLVQHKGGPCGLLAGVQAYILKHLMFTDSKLELTSSPRPTHKERVAALVAALADILWKAGQQKSATVAVTTRNSVFGGKISDRSTISSIQYKPDNLTETLLLQTFTAYGELCDYIESQVPILQDVSSSGCIFFLYSLLLTRGIENIKSDMDSDTTLLGAHGYCTQELMNLILTGFAVSNVFNGTQELDSGGEERVILRGTQGPCELGFLSLFEHYGACTVGSNLKDPKYPIWVVCSESHFTVLFSHQRRLIQDLGLETKFDLHYYDGLANQDEAIILTIDNSDRNQRALQQPISDDDLVPPLELVIKTKWKLAEINWNKTEPIL